MKARGASAPRHHSVSAAWAQYGKADPPAGKREPMDTQRGDWHKEWLLCSTFLDAAVCSSWVEFAARLHLSDPKSAGKKQTRKGSCRHRLRSRLVTADLV